MQSAESEIEEWFHFHRTRSQGVVIGQLHSLSGSAPLPQLTGTNYWKAGMSSLQTQLDRNAAISPAPPHCPRWS
ncbi:hypothetical protein VTN96DRAFT_444 [Rasamsonia emersonii]